ncbi:putative glucan 1,3-beta-glucosidase A [Senna tora]|uniref:Putative glucan 1,3-beta-glucosidase A n=1 Tax=Senna tora TaxID=362788 RepID=A0A834W9S1_9FABA|nr:putative glucan 1,3-beta-glucosidase A [Senna tora]
MASAQSGFKVRGTNLAGWLLIEGFVTPHLFDLVPNKDFLDGTTLEFESVATKKNLCVNPGEVEGGDDWTNAPDKFRLWRLGENTFEFRLRNGKFVGLDGNLRTNVVAVPTNGTIKFEIIKKSDGKDCKTVRIRASTGKYLRVHSDDSVTADVAEVTGWEDNDPTVFNYTMVPVYKMAAHTDITGDFQLQNGLGSKAAEVMQKHYESFVVEKDFELMREYGVNAVRIPVGWWTAYDPNPPFPYVSGSLKALDNALYWAQKYGIKVILDLHAAPGSQSGVAHSGTRDGSVEWGKTDETINQTLEVIEIFAKRYQNHESLYGIELLNEPRYPDVSLESVEKYYRAAHGVIRKYNPTVHVIFNEMLSFDFGNEDEHALFRALLPLAKSLDNTVIDVHWYNFFIDSKEAKDHINYVTEKRNQDMSHHTTHLTSDNGKVLLFIGEWSCGGTTGAELTESEAQEFVRAQIQVYDQASFGWTFLAWNHQQHFWSLKWLLQKNLVNLRS